MNDQISRQKLKPCPFCGGKASTTKRERWKDEACTYSKPDYGVSCQECYAKSYQYYSTIEEAIEAWNKRVEPPADQWIPCSSGTMPSFLQPCFITVEYVSGLATTFRAVYWETHWATAVENIRLEAVTAWMPAEPYKEVK